MRNLKRALSLTLASVMLLGMMVVGSSAAGYPDVSEEENIEAIEVLQSVGVMEGDNNGNFNPDDYVTREQMAVIMSKLLNLDYNYYQGTNPFSDVPAWAAPYVAACAANGITSGIGGGMYGAGQNVNAVQAALMMLKALGYFQYQQDFGDDYVLATVKQATEVGLFKLIDSNAQQALTRNEVAQMSLNALQADLVRFTGDPGVEYTGTNGESWIGGYKAEYTPRTSTDPKYNRLIDNKHSTDIDTSGQYYCQLGEELYNGDLVQRYDSDIFQRPSYTWTYKTEMIGTYVDKEKFLASYDSGVKGRTLYDLLNNITIKEYTLETYVDGHPADSSVTNYSQYGYASSKEYIDKDKDLVRSNDKNVGITGNGVETEVYLDRDNRIITIVSIHTWLANGSSSYAEAKETASMKIYLTDAKGVTKVVDVEDVPEVTGVAKDGWYLVQMSDKDTKLLEVAEIMEPEILTDSTITKFSTTKQGVEGDVTKLTTGGNQYSNNVMAYYDDDVLNNYNDNLLTNASYNVYLDQNGYFVGVDLFEGDKNYVFVTGYDMNNSNLSVKTAQASGIFLDGTMKSMTVNVTDTNKNIDKLYKDVTGNRVNMSAYYIKWDTHASKGVYTLNRWYTYTETADGVYTLKPCYNSKNNEILMMASEPATASDTMTLKCDRVTLDSVKSSGAAANLFQGESRKYNNGTYNYKDTVAVGANGYNVIHQARAYGEDDSVFITVDTDNVSATANGITRAITDVKGVYTGVQNVELIAESNDRIKGDTVKTDNPSIAAVSDDYFAERAYTVYDKDHFIIGSIILGSAKGGVENYAYILDPVKSEEKIDDTYYWEFDAVFKGEIVTLTAKSKYLSTINTLKSNQYKIVELRMDGEYVTDVEALKHEEIYGADGSGYAGTGFNEIKSNIGNQNVYDVILDDNGAWVNIGTSRERVTTAQGTLYLQGRTLYVLSDRSDKGLAFVNDAKAVVRQVENGDWENTEFTSVDAAVAWLADADNNPNNGKQFNGVITAVLNSQGVAEWVVFYTDTELVAGANRPPVSSASDMTIKWEVSYDAGVTYVPYNTTTTVSATGRNNGDPVVLTPPAISGMTAQTSPVIPFSSGTTVTVRAVYAPRAVASVMADTSAMSTLEIVYNGTPTYADLVAAGLKVKAVYDNGDQVDVTSDAAAPTLSGAVALNGGGGSATPVDTGNLQVAWGGKTSANFKVKYLNTTTLTPVAAGAIVATDWTAALNKTVVKPGDVVTATITQDNGHFAEVTATLTTWANCSVALATGSASNISYELTETGSSTEAAVVTVTFTVATVTGATGNATITIAED